MSKIIAKKALWIICITLVSKLIGFLRDVILAARYGTTIETDSFIMAQTISDVMISLVIVALGTTFIPVMSDYISNKSKQEVNKFINVVYTFSISITVILCVFAMIFTKEIVKIFAPNYSYESLNLTIELTRIILPSTIVAVIVALNNAKLQNHGYYLIPAAIGFPWNLSLIFAMIFLRDIYSIQGLTYALAIGIILQLFLQAPFVKKLNYKYKIDFDIKEQGLRRIGILIVPIMIGSGIQEINTLVDRILSSGLPQGSLSALNFSNRLNTFIIGLLSAAVTSIYYTSMSKYFSEGNSKEFKKLLKNTINVLIVIVIPASAGFYVLRLPIIQLIFQRGLFDVRASEMTAEAMSYLIIGLIGFSLRDVLSRAFYALQDTKTAMVNGSLAIAINIVASIIFVPYLGLGGIALGTTTSGIVGTLLLLLSLHKKIGDFGLKEISVTLIKVTIVSIIMAISTIVCYRLTFTLFSSNIISLLFSVIVGVLLYCGLILLLNIEEINSLKRVAVSRIKLMINLNK